MGVKIHYFSLWRNLQMNYFFLSGKLLLLLINGNLHLKFKFIIPEQNVLTIFLSFCTPDISQPENIDNFVKESILMLGFDHPNVLKLLGVCFDTTDYLPLIVLPFMANGDLRSYLLSKRDPSVTTKICHFPEVATTSGLFCYRIVHYKYIKYPEINIPQVDVGKAGRCNLASFASVLNS